MAEASTERWVTVRVQDTADGLIIHPDDAREYDLDWDKAYKGYVTHDGNLRIPLPATPEAKGGGNG